MNSSLTYLRKHLIMNHFIFLRRNLDFSVFEQGQEKVSAKVTAPEKTPNE